MSRLVHISPSLALAAALGLTTAPLAFGQTWTGAVNSNWATGGNWSGGSVPSGNSDIVFGSSSRLDPTLSDDRSVRSITFSSNAPAYSLGGGTPTSYTLTIGSGGVVNNSTATQTFTGKVYLDGNQTWNTASGDIVVSGALASGWITFTKTGSGSLTLSGSNSGMSGTFAIQAGTVIATQNNALGSQATYNDSIGPSGTLALQGDISLNKGDIFLSGSGAGSGGAIRNISGNNTINADLKLTGGTSIVSDGGQLTLGNQVQLNGHTLTLDGAGSIVTAKQISNTGSLLVTGSGARTFNGAVTVSGGLEVKGSGNVVFNQNINGNGPVTLRGTGSTTLNGAQLNASTVSIESGTNTISSQIAANTISVTGGTNVLGGVISATTFAQSGGTTTFAGSGAVNLTNFDVTGGEVIFDKTGDSFLHSSTITITGATVSFLNDDQIFEWDDVTLGPDSVLHLNNTTQKIDQLTITGNTIIDFGDLGSDFDIGNLTLLGDSVLTIINWNDDLDKFLVHQITPPEPDTLAKIVFEGIGEAAWDQFTSGAGLIVPTTPVPEPATTGLLMLGGIVAYPVLRRPGRRANHHAGL